LLGIREICSAVKGVGFERIIRRVIKRIHYAGVILLSTVYKALSTILLSTFSQYVE